MGTPAAPATTVASRRPSDPMSPATCARSAGMPSSSNVRSHAAMRMTTVSTSVPSRSKITASMGRRSGYRKQHVPQPEGHHADRHRALQTEVEGQHFVREHERAHDHHPDQVREAEEEQGDHEGPAAADAVDSVLETTNDWRSGLSTHGLTPRLA